MAEKKFSDLTTASQINETDIAAISQESNGVLGSFKATIGAIGQKIITGINFANAFNTNAKTVAGAVNEKLTSNAVADIEVSPAESAHSEGDYLIYNGLLYLVIDDIAIGDALTTGAGGNIEIAQIADGIGGAGHDILNDAGSTLPKEGKLQFVGVYVHDDSINGKTVVENYREMTAAEYAQLTAEQKKGLINILDEQGHPITASATGFDNTGTSFEGDNVQEVLEEVDTALDDLSPKTILSIPANTYSTTRQALVALYNAFMTIPQAYRYRAKIVVREQVQYSLCDLRNLAFTYTVTQLNMVASYSLYISSNSSNCYYLLGEIGSNSTTIYDRTDNTQSDKIDLII